MYYFRMKQKYISLMVFCIILLLFIAGCKGGKDTAKGAPTTPFLGGTQGLEIKFLNALPPDEVTDSDSFPFQAVVSLKNMGEYNLKKEQVEVSLMGFLPNDFRSISTDFADNDLTDRNPENDLSPKQRDSEGNIIEPIETIVTFPRQNKFFKYKGKLAGNTDFTFRADVCYKYQTKAVSEICVLANQIDVADDAVCKPSETKSIFSSASPLQVTAFRQNVAGENMIQFSFDIVHSGQGDVFIEDEVDANDVAQARKSVQAAKNAVANIIDSNFNDLKNTLIPNAEVYVNAIVLTTPSTIDNAKAILALVKTNAESLNYDAGTVGFKVLETVKNEMHNALDVLTPPSCPKSPTERRIREDMVKVNASTGLAANSLTCVGLPDTSTGFTAANKFGTVKLVNGKRTITCTQDLSSYNTDFKRSIDITLSFNYLQSIDKNVLVKHLS